MKKTTIILLSLLGLPFALYGLGILWMLIGGMLLGFTLESKILTSVFDWVYLSHSSSFGDFFLLMVGGWGIAPVIAVVQITLYVLYLSDKKWPWGRHNILISPKGGLWWGCGYLPVATYGLVMFGLSFVN